MSQYHDLNTILTALRAYILQNKSGTFFVATDDNASARFALHKGKLTFCSFKRFNGPEAVKEFSKISLGRYSFSDADFPFRDNSLIDHKASLQTLGILLKNPSLKVKDNTDDDLEYRTYRGQQIPMQQKEEKKAVKYRMYRGQKIPIEESAEPEEKKKVRYYRGQRIEE